MRTLTHEEFNDLHIKVMARMELFENERIGQAYFNVLNELHPDIAKEIRGSPLRDPFYNDPRLPFFFRVIFPVPEKEMLT